MSDLRILFEGGTGDAFTTLREWNDDRSDGRTSHVAYSRQFYDVCRELGAQALVTCSFPGRENVAARGISVEYRPSFISGRSGLGFYLAQLSHARQIILDARRFRANVAIVFDDVLPFVLQPLRALGVSVVQSLHCVLWPQHGPISSARRFMRTLSRSFYRSQATAILSASDVISAQVSTVAGGASRPIIEFLPSYAREHYSDLCRPPIHAEPLEVIFVGRAEENKGVLDLIAIADLLEKGGVAVHFHVCGDGGALARLRSGIVERRLESSFTLHGWCDLEKLRSIYSRSHVAIVPTRTDFVEGFNQAVVEAVLAGTPPIVSSVCPAARYVLPAAEIVAANDVDGYAKAIRHLARDRDMLSSRIEACANASAPFLCSDYSYASALREVLGAITEGRPPQARHLRLPSRSISGIAS